MEQSKSYPYPGFPISRPRRLRMTPTLRSMLRETVLSAQDFIYPLFVRHGMGIQSEIHSMPGQYQWTVDLLPKEVEEIARLGIPAVLLFGIPDQKDPIGVENYAPDGIIQQAIRQIKAAVPELAVVTDVYLCEYTDHGHCGILNTGVNKDPRLPEGYVLNDPTL